MIIYPESGYASFLSEEDADSYFESRTHSSIWDHATNKEAALMTAYRSLQELDIVLDLSEADQLKAIQQAQAEQCLHELNHNLDTIRISGLTLGAMLKVKIPSDQGQPPMYSPRALAILKPYLRGKTISRAR
jgi:hypothetical protein